MAGVELYTRAGSLVLINVATLLQLAIFAMVLITTGVPKVRHRSLMLILFFAFAASKFDDVWQLANVVEIYPQLTFAGAMAGLLIGPAVYFYVQSRTQSEFVLRPGHLLHLLWLVPPTAYLAAICRG